MTKMRPSDFVAAWNLPLPQLDGVTPDPAVKLHNWLHPDWKTAKPRVIPSCPHLAQNEKFSVKPERQDVGVQGKAG